MVKIRKVNYIICFQIEIMDFIKTPLQKRRVALENRLQKTEAAIKALPKKQGKVFNYFHRRRRLLRNEVIYNAAKLKDVRKVYEKDGDTERAPTLQRCGIPIHWVYAAT